MADSQKHLDLFVGDSFREWEYLQFSWAAAFWSFFWFWWRKMWLIGTVLLILFQGSNYLLHMLLDVAVSYGWWWYVLDGVHMAIMAAVTGFAAPRIYVWWVKRRVSTLYKNYGDLRGKRFEVILVQRGGTDIGPIIWVVGVAFGLLALGTLMRFFGGSGEVPLFLQYLFLSVKGFWWWLEGWFLW